MSTRPATAAASRTSTFAERRAVTSQPASAARATTARPRYPVPPVTRRPLTATPGGCAPEPHRRPASWRSLGRPCARCARSPQHPGAAPPNPIAVRRTGARSAGRALAALAHRNTRGLRPRTPSPSGELALARPAVRSLARYVSTDATTGGRNTWTARRWLNVARRTIHNPKAAQIAPMPASVATRTAPTGTIDAR